MGTPETPEYQQQEYNLKGISIPRLISAEFGSVEWIVRQQLNNKATVIELDGVEWAGDRLFIPRDELLGKEIVIVGPDVHWKLKYPESK